MDYILTAIAFEFTVLTAILGYLSKRIDKIDKDIDELKNIFLSHGHKGLNGNGNTITIRK